MTPEEIAEQWKKEGEARINGQQRTEVIKINVDNQAITDTINENKKLKAEIEEGKDATDLFTELKEKASVELTSLGVNTEVSDLKSKNDLDRAITTIQKLKAGKGSNSNYPSIPSGTVPLSSQTPAKKSGYSNVEQMVDDANQNKEIRNALLSKCLKGVKEGHLILKSYELPLPETQTSDLIENGKLSKKPDVLGIQHMHRTKKLRERAEKGDSQAIDLLNSGNY